MNTFRLIVMLVSLLGLIAVTEVGLRITGHPASWSAIFEFDEMLGYRYRPGNHLFSISGEVYEVEIDGDGLVDRIGGPKVDVVILGDGVVAGLEARPQDRLAHLVGSFAGVATANLSVPGYGTVQQLISLEKWIEKHGAPKKVFLVYNVSNDYFDNVQEWEGSRVPGIAGEAGNSDIIAPINPGWLGVQIRRAAWNSRIITRLTAMKERRVGELSQMPKQQKLLFSNRAQPDARVGNVATQLAAERLNRIAAQHSIDMHFIFWRDVEVEEVSNVSAQFAMDNLQKLLGVPSGIEVVIFPGATDALQWSRMWLHRGTRHANSAALRQVCSIILNRMGIPKCH